MQFTYTLCTDSTKSLYTAAINTGLQKPLQYLYKLLNFSTDHLVSTFTLLRNILSFAYP